MGDARSTLRHAVQSLLGLEHAGGGARCSVSALYRTEPVGGPPQPEYLNAAVGLCLSTPPAAVLLSLMSIERGAGRVRAERWGARTLDLDMLWIEGIAVDSPELTVPHPRLQHRAFALVPLLDVAPDATDPGTGEAYAEVARRVGNAGVLRVADSGWHLP